MKAAILSIIVSFISVAISAQNIPNSGFERWTILSQQYYNPDGWNTNTTDYVNTIERETPGYAGTYALRINAYGYAEVGLPVTAHPGIVGFSVHTGYAVPDTVSVEVTIYKNGMVVDGGYWVNNKSTPITAWTGASVPISQNNPSADSVRIRINGGQKQGTYIVVDAFSFAPPGTLVAESSLITGWQVFPNPATDYVELRYTIPQTTNLTLRLYGADGQLVQTYKTNEITQPGSYTERLDLTSLARGSYSLEFFNGTQRTRQPLVIK